MSTDLVEDEENNSIVNDEYTLTGEQRRWEG